MAIITCPECSREVSDMAAACPGCGYPIKPPEKEKVVAAPSPAPITVRKSRGVFIILGMVGGLLGIHNFYAGYFGRGASQCLLTLLLGWTYIVPLFVFVWAVVELFMVDSDASDVVMA